MFILDKPYVSDFLQNTAIKYGYPVLNNKSVQELDLDEELNFICEGAAINRIKEGAETLLYSNSENAIDWISKNLDFTEIPEKINLFKDKVKFRKLISEIYHDFYFREIDLDEIQKIKTDEIPYPVVLKPSIGFLSFGVYTIYNAEDWKDTVKNLKSDIEKFKSVFPNSVVDASKFIIEKLIEGKEFAADVYFNRQGEPVILNIFHHPFVSKDDVSDRVYFTSKKIIETHLDNFTNLFKKIAKSADLKNFPAHIELRADDDGNITPIEVNPMRFAGWCISDLAHFSYGVNVYEYYFEQYVPDWKKILENTDNSIYYFVVAENPSKFNKNNVIDYEEFLKNIKNPLDIRKIDPKTHPVFAIVFAKTDTMDEIYDILKLDFNKFVK